MRKHERKNSVCGSLDLEKPYDRVNREAPWQALRMYDVGGKLLNGIKSMYVNSLALQFIYGCSDERGENGEEGREWRFHGLLYADNLVLCGELEEDLRAMVGCFAKVCKRRGLKLSQCS